MRATSWFAAGILGGALASPAAGQIDVRALYGVPGERFGSAVDGAGDVNNDGRGDIVVGAPFADVNGTDSGRVLVYSGADLSLLYVFDGVDEQDRFGSAVAGAGDVDDDGFADVVVGASRGGSGGQATVFSGQTGAVLYLFDALAEDGELGSAVDGAGDVDDDGHADVVVGIPSADPGGVSNAGRARVYSGRTGAVLYTFDGAWQWGRSGSSVAGVGDIDDDQHDDVAVGAPGLDAGWVTVYSGADGSTLVSRGGAYSPWGHDQVPERFGTSLDGAGDVDGDGRPDWIGGGSDYGPYEGRARVFSGATGSVVRTFQGIELDDLFASQAAGAGDVDGDGLGDLVISNPWTLTPGARVAIFSGADGSSIHTFHGDAAHGFGSSVAGAGDTDGDGLADVVFGISSDGTAGAGAGSVRIVSGLSSGSLFESYCFGTAGTCPCGNAGDPGHGCDLAQGTGGIELTVQAFAPDGLGGGAVELVGTGYPPASQAGVTLIRSPARQDAPTVFGDGLLCIDSVGLVRVHASLASGGTSTSPVSHGAGVGTFYYQVWVRNNPATFCDPTAAFNLSNGVAITWP